jgi:hypothetical protein
MQKEMSEMTDRFLTTSFPSQPVQTPYSDNEVGLKALLVLGGLAAPIIWVVGVFTIGFTVTQVLAAAGLLGLILVGRIRRHVAWLLIPAVFSSIALVTLAAIVIAGLAQSEWG